MSIFKKTSRRPLETIDELAAWPVPRMINSYESSLDYIVGLSDKEFDRLIKVANIYRQANKDANKALGIKREPLTTLGLEEQDQSDDIQTFAEDVLQLEDSEVSDMMTDAGMELELEKDDKKK